MRGGTVIAVSIAALASLVSGCAGQASTGASDGSKVTTTVPDGSSGIEGRYVLPSGWSVSITGDTITVPAEGGWVGVPATRLKYRSAGSGRIEILRTSAAPIGYDVKADESGLRTPALAAALRWMPPGTDTGHLLREGSAEARAVEASVAAVTAALGGSWIDKSGAVALTVDKDTVTNSAGRASGYRVYLDPKNGAYLLLTDKKSAEEDALGRLVGMNYYLDVRGDTLGLIQGPFANGIVDLAYVEGPNKDGGYDPMVLTRKK